MCTYCVWARPRPLGGSGECGRRHTSKAHPHELVSSLGTAETGGLVPSAAGLFRTAFQRLSVAGCLLGPGDANLNQPLALTARRAGTTE